MPVDASQTILSTSTLQIIKETTPTGTIEVGYAPPAAGGQLILTPATPYPDSDPSIQPDGACGPEY